MEKYSQAEFRRYLLQGKLKKAFVYLKQFPDQKKLILQYQERFEQNKFPVPCDNEKILRILNIFYSYYHRVFWEQLEEEKAKKKLIEQFFSLLSLSLPENLDEYSSDQLDEIVKSQIDPLLQAQVESEGYHYLGGITQGFLGPYVWKSSQPDTFLVQLPTQTMSVTVNMLRGFISRSWLDYISFGEIGADGWAGEDNQLYCVIESYAEGTQSDIFQINYLKHEAQHLLDYQLFPGISSAELEYRAKLIELIYQKGKQRFYRFLREADNNPKNSHSYASFCIMQNLAKRLNINQNPSTPDNWEHLTTEQISNAALQLYQEYQPGII